MVSVIEKVTGIDITILNMIHIRIKYINGKLTFELIDGQQRITTILDFKNNIYPLGDNFFVGDELVFLRKIEDDDLINCE